MKLTVEEIIKRCGGDMAVAFRLGRHQVTVYRWRETGIPSKYWREVIELFGENHGGKLTLEDILSANERTKQSA